MSNYLRRIKRKLEKDIIVEFQKETGWSDLQIIGLCATMKKKTSLSGKVDAIIDVQIKAMEEKYDGAKIHSNEIEDAVLVEDK